MIGSLFEKSSREKQARNKKKYATSDVRTVGIIWKTMDPRIQPLARAPGTIIEALARLHAFALKKYMQAAKDTAT